MRLKDRLKAFIAEHQLTHEEMAALLSTPYGTFKKWMMTHDTQPPACLITLMNILERVPEARHFLCIKGSK